MKQVKFCVCNLQIVNCITTQYRQYCRTIYNYKSIFVHNNVNDFSVKRHPRTAIYSKTTSSETNASEIEREQDKQPLHKD